MGVLVTGLVPGAPAPLWVISAIVREGEESSMAFSTRLKLFVNQPQKSTRLRLSTWHCHRPTRLTPHQGAVAASSSQAPIHSTLTSF